MEANKEATIIDIKDAMYKVTAYATNHDEKGLGMPLDLDKVEVPAYWEGQRDNDNFDEIIRPHVFMLLKYFGDFGQMVASQYFNACGANKTADDTKIQHGASTKLPFMYVYETCPQDLKPVLMSKYLENQINPLPLIQYDQRSTDNKRTFHLKDAYDKLRSPYGGFDSTSPKGNLICVGNSRAGKSYFLNEMLKMQFELSNKTSLGLFHNSVEVTFATPEVIPTKFNVFDFQGQRANEDFELICGLLQQLPFAYLFVQVHEETYLDRLFGAMKGFTTNPELLQKFTNRVVVISRDSNTFDDIESKTLEYFGRFDKFDGTQRIFDIGDIQKNSMQQSGIDISYARAHREQTSNKSAQIFKFITNDMTTLEATFF